MKYKIALAQINPVLGDINKNKEIHIKYIEKAMHESASIIAFPELSLTGYLLKDLVKDVALSPEDPFFEDFIKLSKKISIVLGFTELGDDFMSYNSLIYFEDGEIKNVYRKIFLPNHGMFEELKFFGKGNNIQPVKTKFGLIGLLICRDLFHPSLIYSLAMQDAKFIIVPSNMPLRGLQGEKPAIQETVEIALKTYANFYGIYIAYINRVGFEDGIGFYGGSKLITPSLKFEGELPLFDEGIGFATLNYDLIYNKRTVFPLLREEKMALNTIIESLTRDRS